MALLRDILTTTSGRIISLLLGIGIASASAWLLGPDGRGELAIYLVFGTLLVILTSSGVEMGVGYYAGSSKYELARVLPVLLFSATVSLVISALLAGSLWIYQPEFIHKINGLGILFVVFFVPMMLLSQSMQWLHSSLGDLKSYAIGQIVNAAVCLLGILILCWNTRQAEYGMIAYVMGSIFAVSYMLWILTRKHSVFPFAFSWRCLKDIYSYGFRYFFARMAQFLNVQVATFVITFIGTKEQIGIFSASIGLISRLTILSEILNAVLLSRVLKQQLTSVALVAKAVRMTFWLTFFAGGIIAIFCKPMVALVLSPDFLPAVPVIWILLPGVIIRCCAKTLEVYFNGIGRPGVNSVGIVCAVITNIILMYHLILPYGVRGAAIAAACGYVVDGIILILYYKFALKNSLLLLVPMFSDITNIYLIIIRKRRDIQLKKAECETLE